MSRVVTPRERLGWQRSDYEAALLGAMVEVDTPGDAVDAAQGVTLLSDFGVVTGVYPGPDARWRVRFDDGFDVLVDIDSALRVCRDPGHQHEIGSCPALHPH